MTLYKRGDVYHYRFTSPSGERYRGSTGETSLGKARTYESVLIGRAAEEGALKPKKSPTLREAAKRFLVETDAQAAAGNLGEDTRRHYHNGWRMLSEMPVADRKIDRITTGMVAALKFPGGPWNARAGQQVLGRILNWCAEAGLLYAAPKIKRAKAHGREQRIERSMEVALLRHMERDVADVFVIMLSCGMRPEEVMRMRWDNIAWDRSEYFNPHGKTKASRRFVPISDRMASVLRSREGNLSGWVFPDNKIGPGTVEAAKAMFAEGKSVRAVSIALGIGWPTANEIKAGSHDKCEDHHRVTVQLQWEGARRTAGIDPKIVLYSARHEFAYRFLKPGPGIVGGDLGTLMKIMGHTSISVTSKYLHPDIEGAADIINKGNAARLQIVKRA